MWNLLCVALAAFLLTAAHGAVAADKTGVTDKSIKIGLFGPLTGGAGAGKKSVFGAASIYKDINDRGGINGRKIELVIEDDGCDGAKGNSTVDKLIKQDKVFLLHGAWCSKVALAIKPTVIKNPRVPYIVLGAVAAEITADVRPNIFQPVATSQTVGEQMIDFALTKPGAKRVAIIGHTDQWGISYRTASINRLKARGLEPVVVLAFERGDKDATSQVSAIKASEPDAVMALLYPDEMEAYLREAYKQGLKTTTLGATATSIDETNKRIGIPEAISDVYMAFSLRGTITSPELKKFADMYKRYYPSESLDQMGFYSMDGALVIAEVIKRLGHDVTRERFLAELNKIKNYAAGVQAGTITFTPADHRGIKSVSLVGLVKQREAIFHKHPSAAH